MPPGPSGTVPTRETTVHPIHRRPVRLVGIALLALAMSACGEPGPSAAEIERRAVAREQARIRRENRENPPVAPPLIPFEVGQRAGLGPWQFSVDGFEVGPVITVRGTITNARDATMDAPPATTFELRDGAAPSNAPAAAFTPSAIEGLPPTLEGRTPTVITIRFTPPTPVVAPILLWNGDAIGSFDALFRIGEAPPATE